MPCAGHATSLLDLPRELRDRIWDFALVETTVHIEKDNHLITLAYPATTTTNDDSQHPNDQQATFESQNTPQWLLTNKQFLSEGLDQFSRRAACINFAQQALSPKQSKEESPPNTHQNLLITHTKQISLPVRLQVFRHEYNETIKDTVMDLHTSPFAVPHGHDRGGPDYRLDPGTKIADFLPKATNLHLRVEMIGGIERNARPKLIRINAGALRFLGTDFNRVRVSIAPPNFVLGRGRGSRSTGNEGTAATAAVVAEDYMFPPIAPLAAYYARMQRALVQLAGHLSRHLGPSQEYRESRYWWVSEHMMHPCAEYEVASGDDDVGDAEYEITDRMVERRDGEGGEWHLFVTRYSKEEAEEETIGEKEKEGEQEEEDVIHLHNLDLRYFRVTAAQAQDQDALNAHPHPPSSSHLFKRDAIAKLGTARSWSCASTGDVVWIEDRENAVTGWLLRRRDQDGNGDETKKEEEDERRLMVAEPNKPAAAA
ncbi:hypothetical protein N0V83_006408 [Neocucurbitaria cava]|uniref:2EXR domain-containing protein n=1 Tax=Neocucurbitaria cava TaxID=798079 RepID=A0A9W8Y5C6_9PLEO|nr:hypothetical protein N0V83_006408 [Neocucurbitaria cava]